MLAQNGVPVVPHVPGDADSGTSEKCDNARGDRPHSPYRHETYFVTFYILALASRSFKDFPFLYERIGGCLNIWRSSG